MKLWQKIFIYSFLLFITVFNIAGFFLVGNSHNLSLHREIDRGLSEQGSLVSGIKMNLSILKYMPKYSEKDSKDALLKKVVNNYASNFRSGNAYIEILDKDDNAIFTNINFHIKGKREELKNPLVDRRNYIIRDIGNKTFLFVTSAVDNESKPLKLTYARDITYVYQDKKNQITFFLAIDGIVSIAIALGLYILCKMITNPINRLTISTKNFSNGNYSERVSIDEMDEIGILSKNFNFMASSIEQKINELQKITDEKQRFIDNLTHEMKTPLTSIIGYADFLRSTKYNEKTNIDGLNNIYKEGKRLAQLSKKMMDLSLLKREDFILKKENIKDILLEVKDALKPRLDMKNIELTISGDEFEVEADRYLIKNLIENLVDNAIKASYNDSKIYINLHRNKDLTKVVEIKDEGIGIPEEDIQKIFEPFYMVDKSRARANNGAGLGLSICAEIARIHKAQLKIESKVNFGTTIKIIFV